jgi:hypothetical protein
MTNQTPAALIAEILQLDDWVDAQMHKVNEYLKPHREKIEALKMQLHEQLLKLNEAKEGEHPKASISTGAGTAYLSTIVTPSIDGDKTAFLDWCIENWDERGAMLQIGAPQKNALQEYQDAHNGQLPPHVKTSSITRVNIRRS